MDAASAPYWEDVTDQHQVTPFFTILDTNWHTHSTVTFVLDFLSVYQNFHLLRIPDKIGHLITLYTRKLPCNKYCPPFWDSQILFSLPEQWPEINLTSSLI